MTSEKRSKKSADETIIVCGPDRAGKTSLIHRILYDTFPETPLPAQTTQFFKQTFSLGHFSLTKPEDKKSITFCEPTNNELLNERYKAFKMSYFLGAEYTLIVLDIGNLPDSQTLKEYFTLADKTSKIHLIINQIDKINQFEGEKNPHQKLEKLIQQLLEKVPAEPLYIHYISAQDNDGIQALRKCLDIPEPHYCPTAQSPTDKPTTEIPLTVKITGEITLAVIVGLIAGVGASFLGRPILGAVVGIGAAAATLRGTTAGDFLAKKFEENNDESLHEPMEENISKKEPDIKLLLDGPRQQSKLKLSSNPQTESQSNYHPPLLGKGKSSEPSLTEEPTPLSTPRPGDD